MERSVLGVPMVTVLSPEPELELGVHFFQATCNCWVNATVASSLESSPEALESLLVRAMRLLMFKIPVVPHGDQTVAVV